MSGAERTTSWLGGTDPGGSPTGRRGEISPLSVVIVLLRGRRLIAGLALLFAIPVGILGLLRPRTYTSESSFVAQSRRPQAALSGFAAQLGIAVGGSEGAQSPDFYVDLVTTRPILKAAIDTVYEVRTPDGVKRGNLVTLYDVDGPTEAARHESAIKKLRESVSAGVNTKTGVISLRVRSPYPALSQQVNARLFALLSAYNLVGRQSQAGAERRFAERRLEEVRQSLREAEERYQSFRQRNRVYSDASSLQLDQQRLEREVQRQQQLYTTLLQMFEQARLEEVRDTPVFSVIETPEVAMRPDPRGVVKRTLLALLAGVLLGAFAAFAREALRRYRHEDVDDSDTLTRLWTETRSDARRLATLRLWPGAAKNADRSAWPR
jgi:uncharacterized protein involved in exopolysaccharide biosynthesis